MSRSPRKRGKTSTKGSLARRWYRLDVLVATSAGTGFFPVAPGTFTSVWFCAGWWFLVSTQSHAIQVVVLVLLIFLGMFAIESINRRYHVGDAGAITIDECIGLACGLILLPRNLWLVIVALILFRLLDIFKPFPIRWLERKVRGTLGIVVDDVIAGLVAGGSVLIATRLFEQQFS